MRASFGALAVLAVVAAFPNEAAAFDRRLCDEVRRTVDNDDLARRISSDPPGGDLECLIRIAALRFARDEALYDAQSASDLRRALSVDDLNDLEELDTRRAVAARLRTAADPFDTDGLYRTGFAAPARSDLFQQLSSRNFLDADTMRVAGADALEGTAPVGPDVPPPQQDRFEVAALGAVGAPAGCLGAAAADDPDVTRNADALEGLCITRTDVSDGEITWPFLTIASRDHPGGPVWYMAHDDGQEAFDAALHAVSAFGGKLVALAGSETRDHAGLDPNRIFARNGDETRSCGIDRPFPNYTSFVAAAFADASHVLTIHNNADRGVTARVRNSKLRGWRARRGPFRDVDNMVVISGTASFGRDRAARRLRDRLLGVGLNVVYEHVTARNNDCSFSNWLMLNNAKPYFNLDAEQGSLLQADMADALLGVLGYRKVGPGE